MRLGFLPLVVLAACFLAGCAEVEEGWVLDEKGGGVYTLSLRWNADLWRRIQGVLGERVMARVQGRAVPLRAQAWREGLSGLEGVEVLELEERDTDTGMRELFVRVKFRHLKDLLRWELMARRTVKVEKVAEEGAAKDAPGLCRFYMEPIARVPVLDRVAALVEAVEKPPPVAEGAAAARDPGPLARLGIERRAADLVWKMLKPQIEKASLHFRFRTPYDLHAVRGRLVDAETREASFRYTWAELRKPTTDRTVGFTWTMRAFDEAPLATNQGDRDPRVGRTPDGRKR